jgi:hypothetical protein
MTYAVSDLVYQYCPFDGSTFLYAERIAEEIPLERLATLDGYACAFTQTLGTANPDATDELAYRVDKGLGPLLASYASTTGVESADCDSVELPEYPMISVEYEGQFYVLVAGLYGCAPTVIESAARNIALTEVVRHTVTYEDYLLSGY